MLSISPATLGNETLADNQIRNNHFWKWVAGVLATLLVAAVVSLVSMIRTVGELEVRQRIMGEDVEANADWIADWYSVLRVPERDQRQDSDIEEIVRQYEEVTRRLRILEGR